MMRWMEQGGIARVLPVLMLVAVAPAMLVLWRVAALPTEPVAGALLLMAAAVAVGVGLATALAWHLVGRPLRELADAATAAAPGSAERVMPPGPMFREAEALAAAIARLDSERRAHESALGAAEAELQAVEQRLSEIAEHDSLTGLANRRALDAALEAAWRRAAREAAPVGLLILGIDHFRAFNERYGTVEGDACLMRVAGVIAALALRPYDLAARLGGDTFGVLLPDSDTVGAAAVGERIRAALHRMLLLHEGSPIGFVTVSVGAASFVPAGFADPRVLLSAADRALAAAKTAGRDCVAASGLARAA
jgi:diguanylate cyclase (GGDEF)-like protein